FISFQRNTSMHGRMKSTRWHLRRNVHSSNGIEDRVPHMEQLRFLEHSTVPYVLDEVVHSSPLPNSPRMRTNGFRVKPSISNHTAFLPAIGAVCMQVHPEVDVLPRFW